MTLEESKFAGGVAVITGAGSGIGAGLARRAGEVGMTVVVTDINAAAAESVAEEIRAAGGKAEAMVVDVSQPAELDRLAEAVFAKHGSVRLLVNNAGIETLGFAWEIPAERWEATLNINLHGVIHGVRAFVPRMLASGEECWIGNLASVGSFGMMPTQSAYMVTKHAVQSFSECLYLEMELKKAPIHVASIIPGMMKTNIFNADRGAGEPVDGAGYRKTMHDMMAAYGMDLAEGCKVIMAGIAANNFWVSSQPEMTQQMLAGRIAFFSEQATPTLNEQTKQLLGVAD
ncbi:MAG: SDR family NAD(P)-dependent oxidoreductase [Sphingomonadaceae bacterium]|nr:SDR family NAD(P)-dependent oxidoreductase [Sphingomonadaceae bacterium]